jgi:putative ABC transport system permease protein
MNLLLLLRVALRALWRAKVRSLLTSLGIIVGIAAVIAMMGLGHGATVMIQKQMSSLGVNLVMIQPGSQNTGGLRGGAGTQQNLTDDDVAALRGESPYVRTASPILFSYGQVIRSQNNWWVRCMGVSPGYLDIRRWDLTNGVFFTDADVRNGALVCVLGATVADRIFGGDLPAGDEMIRIGRIPFRVLGVLSRKGTDAFGHDQDDVVLMPHTTLRRVLQRSPFDNVNQILLSLHDMGQLKEATADMTAILRQRHRLSADMEDDFDIRDMTEVTKMVTSVSGLMTVLLTIVASISLVVGGIGIMNIMLVSVTERTREIGLRMSVGARQRDILRQFLVEAILLAGLGGILGVGVGIGAARIMAHVKQWPVLISPLTILLALGFAAAIGIFFGFYPAWRASRLNPIDALRYE